MHGGGRAKRRGGKSGARDLEHGEVVLLVGADDVRSRRTAVVEHDVDGPTTDGRGDDVVVGEYVAIGPKDDSRAGVTLVATADVDRDDGRQHPRRDGGVGLRLR